MIDDKRVVNMSDRVKVSINHSKIKNISNNGEVESKIIQVRMNTTKKKIKRKKLM